METDPTRMCELLVGLLAERVLGIDDEPDGALWVHIETVADRPVCPGCASAPTLKDRDAVELFDLPAFGPRTRLVWHKRRWACRQPACTQGRGRNRISRSRRLGWR